MTLKQLIKWLANQPDEGDSALAALVRIGIVEMVPVPSGSGPTIPGYGQPKDAFRLTKAGEQILPLLTDVQVAAMVNR